MVAYNLSHLTQPQSQDGPPGPIQDDEALFLFALIRVMQIKNVLELGGLQGYSARNFCTAVGPQGRVYTVDVDRVPTVAPNHFTIQKNASDLTPDDIERTKLDMVFFDCHDIQAELMLYYRLLLNKLVIDDRTVFVFHDTNLRPDKVEAWKDNEGRGASPVEDGWVHSGRDERALVKVFKALGYDAFVLDTQMKDHGPHLPFRHGLTVMRKFKPFVLT